MSILDEQRPLIEDALAEAEGLYDRSGYDAARNIRDLLREVVRLYREDGEIVPTTSFKRYESRDEKRPCKAKCGRPFQPNQLYLPDGPYHIGCSISR